MATNEQREEAMEALELEEIQTLLGWLDGSIKMPGRSKAKAIALLISSLGKRPEERDKFDKLLGLPTSDEQDRLFRQLDTETGLRSAAATERAADAAEDSAKSAKLAIRVSVVALIVAILAIVVASIVAIVVAS